MQGVHRVSVTEDHDHEQSVDLLQTHVQTYSSRVRWKIESSSALSLPACINCHLLESRVPAAKWNSSDKFKTVIFERILIFRL